MSIAQRKTSRASSEERSDRKSEDEQIVRAKWEVTKDKKGNEQENREKKNRIGTNKK
jgi:hypothetical protein